MTESPRFPRQSKPRVNRSLSSGLKRSSDGFCREAPCYIMACKTDFLSDVLEPALKEWGGGGRYVAEPHPTQLG